MQKSKNIKTYAIAESIAVPVSLRTLILFVVFLFTVTCVVFSLMIEFSFQMNAQKHFLKDTSSVLRISRKKIPDA